MFNKSSVKEEKNYYLYNGELYRIKFVTDNKGEVCVFNGWYNNFEGWNIKPFSSLSDLPFDINKATKVEQKDLDIAIENVNLDCKKKFDDFKLDGTLYTDTDISSFSEEVFPAVVRPKKKLVYENGETARRKYILEIEIIDGLDAESKRKFILFHDFILNYAPGCDVIRVVDSDDPFENLGEYKFENYFEQRYYTEISEDEALPF